MRGRATRFNACERFSWSWRKRRPGASRGRAAPPCRLAAGQLARQQMEIEAKIRSLEAMNVPTVESVKDPPGDVFFFQGERPVRPEADGGGDRRVGDRRPGDAEVRTAPEQSRGRLLESRPDRRCMGLAPSEPEALGFKVNPSFRADLERPGPRRRHQAR